MDKLTSMRVFAAVARLGSFSAAADELGISRAMASKYLANLEEQLNVRLLNRTTRQLSLTEVGMAYRDRVQAILDDIEETELAVTQLQTEPRGTLKILSIPSFGSFHLTRAFTDYKKSYPEVNIELILTDRTPDMFEEGIDLAISVGEMTDSSLIARRVATSRIVTCGAPDYLQEYGVPAHPSELDRHNCLSLMQRSPLAAWKFLMDGKQVTMHPEGGFHANTADPLRVAAINSCGLVQLPSYIVGLDIKAGRLKPVLEAYEPDGMPINIVYIHRRHLSAKVRTFVDFICDRFQPRPYWDSWVEDTRP